MAEIVTLDKVYKQLLVLQREVEYIKGIVEDTILTPEEEIELNESLKELEQGNTFSLEDIKKDRKNA